jgi:hypothetical protein
MTALRSFLDEVWTDRRFAASMARKPSLERSFADTKRLFDLLQRSTEPVAIQLRERLEEIADMGVTLKERCDLIEAAIRDALPAIRRRFGN